MPKKSKKEIEDLYPSIECDGLAQVVSDVDASEVADKQLRVVWKAAQESLEKLDAVVFQKRLEAAEKWQVQRLQNLLAVLRASSFGEEIVEPLGSLAKAEHRIAETLLLLGRDEEAAVAKWRSAVCLHFASKDQEKTKALLRESLEHTRNPRLFEEIKTGLVTLKALEQKEKEASEKRAREIQEVREAEEKTEGEETEIRVQKAEEKVRKANASLVASQKKTSREKALEEQKRALAEMGMEVPE